MTTRVRFDFARFNRVFPNRAPSEIRDTIARTGSPRQALYRKDITDARVLKAVDQYMELALLHYALGNDAKVQSCHRVAKGLVRQFFPQDNWRHYLRSVSRKNPLPDARMQVELTLQVGTQEVQDSTVTECGGVSLATLRATGLDVSVSSSAAFPLTKVAVLRGTREVLDRVLIDFCGFSPHSSRDFLYTELA